jgi:hypothetical protein
MSQEFERDTTATANLVLGFAQHLLLANVIKSQGLSNACNQSALESKKCKWNVIYLRLHEVSGDSGAIERIYLVNQFQVCAIVGELVDP